MEAALGLATFRRVALVALMLLVGVACGSGPEEPSGSQGARASSPTESDASPLVAPEGCDPEGAQLSIASVGASWVGSDGKRASSKDVCLAAPANEAFSIEFTNNTNKNFGYIPRHNISIRPETEAVIEQPIFVGKIIGPGKRTIYEVPALEEGVYRFQCDVHAKVMFGVLNVE